VEALIDGSTDPRNMCANEEIESRRSGEGQSPPSVCIVILNYNGLKILGERLLCECIQSILATNHEEGLRVIFVDNGSTDGSFGYVQRLSPRLEVVKLDRNYGYSRGNNIGAEMYDGAKYLAFLNNDVVVNRNWLKPIIEVMESDGCIGIAQPMILNGDGSIQSTGYFMDLAAVVHTRRYDPGKITPIFCASGAALVIRGSLFRDLGGFDEDLAIYYEDTDLCWRALQKGYGAIYVPNARVYHIGGATARTLEKHGSQMDTRYYHVTRDMLWVLIKNSPTHMIIPGVIIQLTFNAARSISLVTRGNFSAFIGIVKGFLGGLYRIRPICRKRHAIREKLSARYFNPVIFIAESRMPKFKRA